MLCALLLYLSNQAQDCCCRCSWCVELVVLVVLVWLVNLVNNMFIYNLTIPLRMEFNAFFSGYFKKQRETSQPLVAIKPKP